MNKIALISLGLAGVTILALSVRKIKTPLKGHLVQRPDLKISGFPIDYEDYMRLTEIARGGDAVEKNSGFLLDYFKAPTIQVALSELNDEITRLERVAFSSWQERKKLLPKDASPAQDKYTKQKWSTPKFSTGTVDEFGRPLAGISVNFGSTVLRVSQEIAPYIPVYGPAVSAGISFMVAIGEGKSLDDAALEAGLNYAKSSVGPAGGIAFNLGVAVASGENMQEASTEAVISELDRKYPGSRNAYVQGKSLYKESRA